MELDGISQNLDVLVMKNLKHDALLGRDMPGLWEVGKRLLYDTLINMVRTRSAPSEELQQLPQDHKEGEAEQSENSEDSEDGDKEITQWKKDIPNEHNHSGEDITSSEDSESEIEDIDDERVNELPENVLEENILLQKDNRISRQRTRVDYCRRVHGHPLDVDIQTLRSEQKADETLKGLWRKVEKGDTGFLVEDGLLWRLAKDRMGDEMTQFCLPASFRSMVLSLAHRPGHLGRDRTTQRILDDYFWPGVHVDVKKLCRACYDCQRAARQYQLPAPLRPLPVIEIPFTRIAMDMIGPFPTTAEGKRFALVVMDYATQWPEAFPLRVTDSVTVADELMILFTRVGVPDEILTDCGIFFVSRLMKELYRLLGVKSITTTPYHPATDGMVERFNATLKMMMRKTSKKWDGQWDLALPFLLGEYRRSPNDSTGFTPSELLYGRQIRGPLQALKDKWTGSATTPKNVIAYITSIQDRLDGIKGLAKEKEEIKKKDHKEHFDKKARERTFRKGELVMLRTPVLGPKMVTEWEGPYMIEEKIDDTTYQLNMPDHPRRKVRRHVNLLKEFVSPVAGCVLVSTNGEVDNFGPQGEEEREGMPLISKEVTEEEKREVQGVVERHLGLIQGPTGLTMKTNIKIETGMAYPISRPPYRLGVSHQQTTL